MAAWHKLAAPIALAIAAPPVAAQQSGGGQTTLGYEQIVSAAQQCLDSSKRFTIDAKELKKRGWRKARLGGMGGLEAVMTGFVRGDGAIMLVFGHSCIVKTGLAPPASAEGLSATISQHGGTQPTNGADGMLAWRLPDHKIELSPGPADGTNVSVRISALPAGME